MKQGRWPLSWASHMRAVALVLVALLCVGGFNPASADAAAPVSGLVTVPALSEQVTDLTGTLDATQRGALEQKLKAFETAKGAQVAVLLLPTTQPETIEQFSIRVMDAWKLGRKGVDDGVLLLVAKNDRRLRIEVGYGLEGALNDATAKRIIAEVITPKLKAGDFIGGIDTGVDAILKVVQGEPLPEPTPIEPLAFSAETLLILMGAAVMGGMFLRSVFGNFLGCSAVGTISGVIGLGWLDSWLGFGGGFIIGVLLAALGPTFLVQMTHGRGGRSGGSWGNSSGGFDGFGSGGGFGGFSGGGGMGGGGGASGGW